MHTRSGTTIYLIRHGETPSNAAKIKQGIRINDYLDTHGILQTEEMSRLVSLLDLDVLFTSYLHRAEETAAILEQRMKTQTPWLHDLRLRERDFGSLSGHGDEELTKLVPDWTQRELMQTYDYRPFGGESVDDVRKRALGALYDIANNYNNCNVGIITHGGIIRLLLFHFPDIPRIYHAGQDPVKDVGNSDIYEWELTGGTIANIKSLLS